MFPKCPKCNAALDPGDAASRDRCPACGLIFAKYLQARQGNAARPPATRSAIALADALADGAEPAADRPADWQNILGDLGLIRRAHLISGIAHMLGLIVMLAAYAWGAALLYLQFRRCDSGAVEEES